VTPFTTMLIIADNLQITHPEISAAVQQFRPGPIQEMVSRCIEAGAQAIDINPGPLPREAEKKMRFLVNAVQEVTDSPLLLDTTNPDALEAGLRVCKNPVIINGFSIEPHKLERILPLARRFDADIVGYLLMDNGQVPSDETDRLVVAVELYGAFAGTGLPPEKLIIDPIIAPVLWDNGIEQDRAVLSVIRILPEILGYPVRTIAALSNLTAGHCPRAKRMLLETAYLAMLAASGLTMVLLNVFHRDTVKTAKTCNALMDSKVFTWEEIP